jgi:ATP-dependent DNA helicase RecG
LKRVIGAPRIDLNDLAKRENEQTEWKESVADIDDVVKTLTAFANDLQNLGGGYVVCGVREDKNRDGFPLLVRTGLSATRFKEIENTVLARCRDRVSPSLAPLVEELSVDGSGQRILVFIQASTGTAHTFRAGNDGAKHFVRVSRSTIEARNGILKDLLVRRGALEPWDRRVCSHATESDIDLLALRDTLTQLGLGDSAPELYLSENVALSAFVPPLMAREPLTGVLRPRYFGLLLFGRNPQAFIPGAVAFFSRYAGFDRSAERGQRLELARTLIDQLRAILPIVEAEAITLFDKSNRTHPSVTKYPARALREAVVNAFVHRDYESLDPLRVTAFVDRIEVLTPGALSLGTNASELENATASPRWRNQTLAWFLARLGYAEAEGQGLRTIQTTLRDAGSPQAEYQADQVRVVCTLRAHPRATTS